MTEPVIPSTGQLVDLAAEEAAQTLFAAADMPLARAEELLAAIQGPALRAVLAMRLEQIVKHGHDAEHDADLPITWLPNAARDHAQGAIEAIGITGRDRDLPLARRRLARVAALCMAAIDRIDVATGEAGQ